ncbi:hypothetical protein E2C01_057633 [Portunus trituberculatus]|uniref:Uncharacterized protein n=1 Tax=Portunus trituberculatus TaxID=210409 RepID=A0A5B7H1N3_PORTR|nr:hypothetical protein [Portunus trituberculatus]
MPCPSAPPPPLPPPPPPTPHPQHTREGERGGVGGRHTKREKGRAKLTSPKKAVGISCKILKPPKKIFGIYVELEETGERQALTPLLCSPSVSAAPVEATTKF